MEPYYLGAYWGGRKESSLCCGERFARCVAKLGEIDPVLGSWYQRAARKAAAKLRVDADPESLGSLLLQGRNRGDVDGDVLEKLGFSFGLWNRASPAVGMSGTLGAHPTFPGVLNNFVLELPPPEGQGLFFYEPRVAEVLFEAVIDAWEPDWATWTSHVLRNAQGAAPREPVVGWMTYLTAPAVADIPGVTSRPLLGGSVVSVGHGVTEATERAVLDSRTRLAKLGLLRPIA